MGKRKKRTNEQPRSRQQVEKPSAPFNNPFSGLAELREELPAKEPDARPPTTERPPTGEGGTLAGSGKLVLQREKKGRAGKTVTRISGITTDRLDEVSKSIKKALGCGATREGSDLVLLGSLVERAERWLGEQGASHIVVSGAGPKQTPKKKKAATAPAAPVEVRGPKSWRESTRRDDLEPGLTVDIVLKKDQRSGTLTRGVIQDVLTRKAIHPHGVKVRLTDGQVGRVKRVIEGCASSSPSRTFDIQALFQRETGRRIDD